MRLTDVGLRDGLQGLPGVLPLSLKLACIGHLVAAGVTRLEVTAFVHPRRVPAMADAEALAARLPRREGVRYVGLALNDRGLDRCLAAGLDEVHLVSYVSAPFAERNAGTTPAASLAECARLARRAREAGLRVQGSVTTAFGCRYAGPVLAEAVLEHVGALLDAGVDVVGLADSTGMGHPRQVRDLAGAALERCGTTPLSLHLHDTESAGYANLLAGAAAGVREFDAAFGGLGGCPFIAGAAGNVATEDAAHLLAREGYPTGVDVARVSRASHALAAHLGRALPGAVYRLHAPASGGGDGDDDEPGLAA